MAVKTITTLIDDLDGSEAKGTIHFAYLGTDYVIDLNAKHERALRKTLGTYIENARPVKTKTNKNKLPARKPINRAEVREWAKENGWPNLSNFGRIPAEVIAAYNDR